MLLRATCIHSNITLEVGFPDVIGVATTPYYFSVRGFLVSWPLNIYPLSYVISVVTGYLTNHVFSTKFESYTSGLFLYCVILNHPVTGLKIVITLRFKNSLFPFLCMTQGPIKYTQSFPWYFLNLLSL